MRLFVFQEQVGEWVKKNFPNQHPYQPLLGLAEEVGELAHAHLKGEQGIRHTPEEIILLKEDAIGDILVFLANYCEANDLSLEECVEKTWNDVKKRDWINTNESKSINSNSKDEPSS